MSGVTEKLKELAFSLGLSTKRVDRVEGYMFDGTTIYYSNFGGRTEEAANSNLAHEIAHFLVASPERRNLPDYGLGSGPESEITSIAILKGVAKNQEEELASMLGMLLEKWVGQDPKTFTWEDHGWVDYEDTAKNALNKLEALGLVKIVLKDIESFESWEFYDNCCDQLGLVRPSTVCHSLDEVSG